MTTRRDCATTSCPFDGIETVLHASDGLTTSRRCLGCAADGELRGWWRVVDLQQLLALSPADVQHRPALLCRIIGHRRHKLGAGAWVCKRCATTSREATA